MLEGRIAAWALAVMIAFAVSPASAQQDEGPILMPKSAATKPTASDVKALLAKAKEGDGDAQIKLSGLYYTGDGVPKSYIEAARWCREAAEKGIAEAELHLGTLYLQGQGVPKDSEKALVWIRKSADQEDVRAEYDLGLLYDNGYAVQKDEKEAAKWYRKAAEQGDAAAQFNL